MKKLFILFSVVMFLALGLAGNAVLAGEHPTGDTTVDKAEKAKGDDVKAEHPKMDQDSGDDQDQPAGDDAEEEDTGEDEEEADKPAEEHPK